MNKSRAVLAALAIVVSLSAFTASASHVIADMTGSWAVSVQTPDQAVTSMLNLQQKGDSLSGSFESELGTAAVRGKVTGDTVAFAFGLDMGGQAIDIRASGLLSDKNNMSGQMEVAGIGAMPFTARRQ